MATSRISNTITDSSGTAIASVPVTVRLMPSGGFRIVGFTEVARLDSTTSDASGFWSLDMERNSNITPANSWYEVTESVPDSAGGKRIYNIAVGASDQSLLASLVTPAQQQPTVVPAGTVYLDQASADARYQAVGSLGSSAPTTVEAADAGTAGVATSASRSDHEHPNSVSTAVPISLANAASAGSGVAFSRGNHVHAYNPPACRVFHNTTQTMTDGIDTFVTFNSERYDTDTMHDTAVNPGRITIRTAGIYVVNFVGELVGGIAYTGVYSYFFLNGVTALAVSPTSTGILGNFSSVTTTYKFIVGDFIEVKFRQTSGANRVLNSTSNYSPEFSATWIGVG